MHYDVHQTSNALNIRYYLRQIFGNRAFVLRIQYFCNGTKNSLQISFSFAFEPNYICLPSKIGQLLQLPTFPKNKIVNTLVLYLLTSYMHPILECLLLINTRVTVVFILNQLIFVFIEILPLLQLIHITLLM